MTVKGLFYRETDADTTAVSVSTNNGISWKDVWTNDQKGEARPQIKLVDEVNGAYDVLVKVTLLGKAKAADARLVVAQFETVTMLNSKTQPMLRLGKNTVYVGTGDETEAIVLWPELQGDKYKEAVVEEKNVGSDKEHLGYTGVIYPLKSNEDGWIVYRIDAPGDIARITYGGRFYNRAPGSKMGLEHSFDGGKTWTKSWSLTDTTTPWDVIHYEKAEMPKGVRSVLVKYVVNSGDVNETGHGASIYAVRMEADYRPADAGFQRFVVAFNWSERQEDYSTVERSHVQLVEKVPFTYTINVGGTDQPIVNSLTVGIPGRYADLSVGYSDGKDVGGEKFAGKWETLGKNLAEGKPYTCTVPSGTNWGAGDPDGKVLTDGVVGPTYVGGNSYKSGAMWAEGQKPEITVDLGEAEKCGAFRIQVGGYPWWDATTGEVKDKAEVLTSLDGKEWKSAGMFDFRLRWKDIPVNYLWPQDEGNRGHNFALIIAEPVEARYVRFKLTPARNMSVSEVQVYDYIKREPFDLKVALPDGKDRSDITQYLPKHTESKPYAAGK
jgi:hypothetical protein